MKNPCKEINVGTHTMSDIKYTSFYFNNPLDWTPRRVVAAYTSVENEDGSVQCEAAFAICNPVDTFNRKHGQMIACNRLEGGHGVTIFSNSDKGKRIQDNVSGEQMTCHDDTMTGAFRRALWMRQANTARGKSLGNLIEACLGSSTGLRNPLEISSPAFRLASFAP